MKSKFVCGAVLMSFAFTGCYNSASKSFADPKQDDSVAASESTTQPLDSSVSAVTPSPVAPSPVAPSPAPVDNQDLSGIWVIKSTSSNQGDQQSTSQGSQQSTSQGSQQSSEQGNQQSANQVNQSKIIVAVKISGSNTVKLCDSLGGKQFTGRLQNGTIIVNVSGSNPPSYPFPASFQRITESELQQINQAGCDF